MFSARTPTLAHASLGLYVIPVTSIYVYPVETVTTDKIMWYMGLLFSRRRRCRTRRQWCGELGVVIPLNSHLESGERLQLIWKLVLRRMPSPHQPEAGNRP